MTLADWMSRHTLTDGAMARLIGIDRSQINRLRRGEARPSWVVAAKIKKVTKGAVGADDFLPQLTA